MLTRVARHLQTLLIEIFNHPSTAKVSNDDDCFILKHKIHHIFLFLIRVKRYTKYSYSYSFTILRHNNIFYV